MAKAIKTILFLVVVGFFVSPAHSGNLTTVHLPMVFHSTNLDRIQPIGDSLTLGFDCGSGLTPVDMDNGGIHPTCTGYTKMALAIASAIARR